jgi:membrane-associated protease RseP (regulator of RpoE activity)
MKLPSPQTQIFLFLACCVTTFLAGGPYFAATLMGILVCHEAGHYFVGKHLGESVSVPYFIPLPIGIGTLGAVIKMDEPVTNRAKLFSIGAAGPIAGLLVAIPLLVVGLTLSEVGPIRPGSTLEGNSVLYALLKYAVFREWLPTDKVDVFLHPMADAGYYGLLVTMINLLPVGQLDGGHIARAALGDRHEVWSKRLHIAMPVVGLAVASVMFVTATRAGKDTVDALSYAKFGLIPWLVWTGLLLWMRRQAGEYHPDVDEVPLPASHRWRAIGMLVVFCLIVTPVPFRPVL